MSVATSISEKPTFKLFYFDFKALAEPIRYLFAYGGQEYEDVRISREEWPVLKPTMPMGQMPMLEVDGHRVHQSISIARYVAKRVGLAGSNDWENLVIDSVVETINDLRIKIAIVLFESDIENKAKMHLTLTTEVIPFYLDKLESIVKDNKGHLALSMLTWADVYFAGILECMAHMAKVDMLEKYPGLRGLFNTVNELEPIKAWIRKRPVSDH